jgi:hypothetical protein
VAANIAHHPTGLYLIQVTKKISDHHPIAWQGARQPIEVHERNASTAGTQPSHRPFHGLSLKPPRGWS